MKGCSIDWPMRRNVWCVHTEWKKVAIWICDKTSERVETKEDLVISEHPGQGLHELSLWKKEAWRQDGYETGTSLSGVPKLSNVNGNGKLVPGKLEDQLVLLRQRKEQHRKI